MRTRTPAAAVAASLIAITCLVSVTAPAQAAAPPAPKVGACYDYTNKMAQGTSMSTRAVSCSATHTAVTFYVGALTGAAKASPVPYSAVVMNQAGRACQLRYLKVMGTRIVLSRANFAWFSPTIAQWKAGARWFRCDAVLYKTDTLLSAIPKTFLTYAKSTAGLNAYRRCKTAAGGTVACSAKHAYKARTYVTLGALSAAYPGDAAVDSKTGSLCSKATSGATRYYTFPLAANWTLGQRTADCYVSG